MRGMKHEDNSFSPDDARAGCRIAPRSVSTQATSWYRDAFWISCNQACPRGPRPTTIILIAIHMLSRLLLGRWREDRGHGLRNGGKFSEWRD